MRSHASIPFLVTACLITAVATSGCGGSDRIETVPVSGTVTFNGKPLQGGGSIRFVPLSGEGKAAGGTIQKDGTFVLSTYGKEDGAIPGEHRVEIVQNKVLVPEKFAPVPDGQEESDAKPISEEKLVPPDALIPEKYSGTESPAKATVSADTPTIDITIK